MRLLRASLAGLLVLSLASLAALALDFPALTGRVVDQADILSPAVRTDVATQSKELEEKSGIQLVVATVPSLQGGDIETFANQLFRAWELGQAQKNNGILLLVAPNERKVRIEVGYGLEGTLTDAISKFIIENSILPRFKAGDFPGGIRRGIEDIIQVLGGDAEEWQRRAQSFAADEARHDGWMALFLVLFAVGLLIFCAIRGGFICQMIFWVLFSGRGSVSASTGSSSSGGGSFGGGGGSFGGGGASGSW
jgi:uncharacterized protein